MGENPRLFSKLVPSQGFLKAGFLGFPGSGKSFTASLLARGLVKHLKDKKPVYVFDTEHGYDYLGKSFEKDNIGIEIARSRSLIDLLDAIKEAEEKASVLIIDSVSHVWEDVVESYKKKNNRTFLTFADWGPIKLNWKKFPEAYLNSRLAIILCGRATDDTVAQENDATGKLEIIKYGVKMVAEKNLGYEPGLVCEMEKINLGTFVKGKRNMVNRMHVLKDRFDKLDGQSFDDPTFDTFLPHIQELNLGVHAQLSGTDSQALFDRNSDRNWIERKKQIEILKEEIQGQLTSAYPGRSTEDVKVKTDLIFDAFGTRSWLALDDKSPDELKKGLEVIRLAVSRAQAPQAKQDGEPKKKEKAEVK